jgi:hypothetical protein
MGQEDKKITDIFGLAPYGEAINTLTKGAVDGAGAFLSRICLPAAEEFGLLLKDKISVWRAKNAVEVSLQAEKILSDQGAQNVHAHPRLVMNILSEGSWNEHDMVLSMWAGLLASSCTESGDDDSNILFVNILSQLTTLQAKIISYGCQNARTYLKSALILARMLEVELDEVKKFSGTDDLHRLDRELDHLSSLGLIGGRLGGGGIHPDTGKVDITPTALALQMYARCQGFIGSPEEYYDVGKDET